MYHKIKFRCCKGGNDVVTQTSPAMVPDEASCRIVNTFVAEYIKSKKTRERDLGHVSFIDKGPKTALICS